MLQKKPSPNPAGPGKLGAAGPLPQFLTFQFGGDTTKRVWVDTPQTYEAAVDHALQEFPFELHGVAREEVGLFANTENQLQSRIGASDAVWRFVAGRLGQSGLVYVRIVRKSPPPPVYREVHIFDQATPLPGGNEVASRKNVGTLKSRFFTLFGRRGA